MGIASVTPTNLLAYDEFNQTAGNLEGKVLPLGGTWAGASKTGENGFKVNATSHVAERAKVSDADLNSGAYALAGVTEYTTCQVKIGVSVDKFNPAGSVRLGVFARYLNAENWLMLAYNIDVAAGQLYPKLQVIKRVAGVVTVLAETGVIAPNLGLSYLQLQVAADGTWGAEVPSPALPLSGQDPVLATGGTLAKGRVGIYDAWATTTATTRTYDRFSALGAEAAGRVCYSGKQVEFNSEGCLRQDSTGTYDGPPSIYRGGQFYLEPEGDSGAINRIIVRMRRNDIEEEADLNVSDKHKIEVLATERFLMPR